MTIYVDVTVNVACPPLERIAAAMAAKSSRLDSLEALMSQISDAIAAANAAMDGAIQRAQADHQALSRKIDDLQARVAASGTPDPADLQALADLKAKADALDLTNPATLPPDQSGTAAPAPTGTPTGPPGT